MIPNMYKIAGELNCFCMHVAARTVATHALSIFGDHSDVMACRQTGFACCARTRSRRRTISPASPRRRRSLAVPFMHFFDGFRTSHEVAKIEYLADDDLRAMMDERHRRAPPAGPDARPPVLRGTAQNPDVFFQAREACNPTTWRCPASCRRRWTSSPPLTGPAVSPVRLLRRPGGRARDRADGLRRRDGPRDGRVPERQQGEKVGVLKRAAVSPVLVQRTLSPPARHDAAIAVLDRTKEPGAIGEPLYQDVVAALHEAFDAGTRQCRRMPRVIGGRYGLSSKEFTPAMVKAVFDELAKPSRRTTSPSASWMM
jgi:pyruvate-ferredoxin/flavodoxin oxidoreductase